MKPPKKRLSGAVVRLLLTGLILEACGGSSSTDGAPGGDAAEDGGAPRDAPSVDVPSADAPPSDRDPPVSLPPSVPLSAATCAASWNVIYRSGPQEALPGPDDLDWRDGTLFVGHGDVGYSWVFSMPDHGGPKSLLYEGRFRGYWLEDQELLYAQNLTLFQMPVTGGPPTDVLHYAPGVTNRLLGNGDPIAWRVLDREALYWGTYDTVNGVTLKKTLRASGQEVSLANVTPPLTAYFTRMEDVEDKLLLAFEDDFNSSWVTTIGKTDGQKTSIAAYGPPQKPGTLLGISKQGSLLWTRTVNNEVDGGYQVVTTYALGSAGTTSPAPLAAAIDGAALPVVAWPAGEAGFYVATLEVDPASSSGRHLSIWMLRPDGQASRLACDPSTWAPSAISSGTILRQQREALSGLAGEGLFFLATRKVTNPTAGWSLVALDSPGFPGATRETGPPHPSTDGGVDVHADAGCPPATFAAQSTVNGHALVEIALPTPTADHGLTAGPDNNVWVGESGRFAKISPAGCVTEVVPDGVSGSNGISDMTAGPDGNLWSVNRSDNTIGRMETSGMFYRPFRLDRGATGPNQIVAGPDGNLWISQFSPSAIVRMTPNGGVTTFKTPTNGLPDPLVVGPDGMIWYGNSNGTNVGRINPQDGSITEFPIGGRATALATASDRNIWLSILEDQTHWVMARMTTAGVVERTPLPYSGAYGAMTKGPDGNLWFTEPPVGRVARLVPGTLELTEFPTSSTASNPTEIIVGPDGNIWFLETGSGRIGRLTP